MRRLRLTLSYDGTEFHGWQVQPGLPTIQGLIEAALASVEKAPVAVAASGRTDAGVHALAQVAACSLRNPIPPDNLQKALNRLLPHAIRVLAIVEVPPNFHPRFDAVRKTYEYRIFRGPVCSPFERRYVHHHPYPLNWDLFALGAEQFTGEQDFTAFAAADEKDALNPSKRRRIFASSVHLEGDLVRYRITGSGFLKHMVRNIVGTLIEVGRGNVSPAQLAAWLATPPAHKAGPTAPASGLFLIDVEYAAAPLLTHD